MITKEIYVADDGTEFISKEECIKYEYNCIIKKCEEMIVAKDIPVVFSAFDDGGEQSGALVVRFNSKNDYVLFYEYIKDNTYADDIYLENSEEITEFPCTVVLSWDATWICIDSVDTVIERSKELIEKLMYVKNTKGE